MRQVLKDGGRKGKGGGTGSPGGVENQDTGEPDAQALCSSVSTDVYKD